MPDIDLRIQGRHEGSTCKKVRIDDGQTTASYAKGPIPNSVMLRIEDNENPAFWIDVMLTTLQLEILKDAAT